ncbi:Myb-like DNA-binding domain containing protein [Trichomonas vaginalis G3]|uniref:Myb-like DNA-binding domain containing protein n=1 Tax=Trichomonas vaginalis (strain ATCC PRA-98 / G3) TaxID=412133 RepID=A2DJP7_TRIV3|nr:RNA polymerase II transcription regulator recruiting protein [Trichomonas vaginalis G3]EAY19447.1 Myb-like DNA-binding domain containing protein [Trichomonas vaginalis G3]KAI5493146.1 RNA polymerase II transcription regulator recruiting protein [Trichomonas vaginalis G3]|eukprot:XP_001580433.1 Myb-like DNA-binding domain containing protein [Trichomonas vaginalis G3]
MSGTSHFSERKSEHGKRKFTEEEDKTILEMVEKNGVHYWKQIAAVLQDRTARQVRERWKHYLSQDIQKAPWTQEEDDLLERQYRKYGPKWSLIAGMLPGRTDVNIKNRWALLCRKKTKEIINAQNNMTMQDALALQAVQLPIIEENVAFERLLKEFSSIQDKVNEDVADDLFTHFNF